MPSVPMHGEGDDDGGTVAPGVGPMVAKVAVGAADQAEELVQVEQDPEEPHHGQLDEREE